MERGSIAIAKSKGDVWQPWHAPLDRGKYSELSKLVVTQAEGTEYKSCIQEMNLDLKPKFSKTENKKFNLT